MFISRCVSSFSSILTKKVLNIRLLLFHDYPFHHGHNIFLTFLGRQKPGRWSPFTSAAADLMSRWRSSIRASWLLASSFYKTMSDNINTCIKNTILNKKYFSQYKDKFVFSSVHPTHLGNGIDGVPALRQDFGVRVIKKANQTRQQGACMWTVIQACASKVGIKDSDRSLSQAWVTGPCGL